MNDRVRDQCALLAIHKVYAHITHMASQWNDKVELSEDGDGIVACGHWSPATNREPTAFPGTGTGTGHHKVMKINLSTEANLPDLPGCLGFFERLMARVYR
jgi:hypothetical protein